MVPRRWAAVAVALSAYLLLVACDSDTHQRQSAPKKPKPVATTAAQPTPKPKPSAAAPSPSPNALQAEANSAATGDIPDNQVFITFRNAGAHYTLKYPEGWAQQGAGGRVTFRDKNNIVRVVVARGAPPTEAGVRRQLTVSSISFRRAPRRVTIAGAPAIALVYATESAANPVTGKRVTLLVDRYYLAHAGKVAVVDLGTPEGVDNVDAYRLMIESFRWR